MKKLKLVKDDIMHEFNIDKRKTLIGNNKHIIFSILKEYLNKSTLSDYAKEYQKNSAVYFDGKLIELKTSFLFELSASLFDLINEYKLTQKSLFSISLESIFNNIDIIDRINTINILLNDLALEIEDYYNNHNINLSINNLEINKKNILKLIDLSLLKNDYQTNQFDYSITELNIIKINLFKMIINNNKQTSFFILNENDQLITDEFLSFPNVYIITVERSNNVDIYDSNNKIDFENDDLLYENYFNSNTNLSFEKYVTSLIERINN